MSKCTYNYNGVEYSELEFKKILKDLELPLSELSQEDLNLFKEHVMFIHDIQNYRLLNRYTVIHNNGYYDTAIRKVLIPVDSINKENILANIIKFKGLNPLFNLYHLFNEHTIKLIDSTPEIDSKDRLYEYRLATLLQNNVENTWLNKLLLDLQVGINNTLNTNYDIKVIKNFLSHNINIVESQTALPDTTESIDVESLLNQLGLNGEVEPDIEPNAEIVNYVTEIRELANTDMLNQQKPFEVKEVTNSNLDINNLSSIEKNRVIVNHLSNTFPELFNNIEVVEYIHSNENDLLSQQSNSLLNTSIKDPFIYNYLLNNSLPIKINKETTLEDLLKAGSNIINFDTTKFLIDDKKGLTDAQKHALINEALNNNDPQAQAAGRYAKNNFNNNEVFKPIVQKLNNQRLERLNEWKKYITEDNTEYAKNPFIQKFIWDMITKGASLSNSDIKSLSPQLNQGVLAEIIYNAFEKSKDTILKLPSSKEVLSYYSDKIAELALASQQKLEVKGKENTIGKWIYIPSATEDSENFEANVKKLQALSYDGKTGGKDWCTRTFNAKPYLEKGGFYLYIEKDENEEFKSFHTKIAIRLNSNDTIAEIQGHYNDGTIPLEYLEQINQLRDSDVKLHPKQKIIQNKISNWNDKVDKAKKDYETAIKDFVDIKETIVKDENLLEVVNTNYDTNIENIITDKQKAKFYSWYLKQEFSKEIEKIRTHKKRIKLFKDKDLDKETTQQFFDEFGFSYELDNNGDFFKVATFYTKENRINTINYLPKSFSNISYLYEFLDVLNFSKSLLYGYIHGEEYILKSVDEFNKVLNVNILNLLNITDIMSLKNLNYYEITKIENEINDIIKNHSLFKNIKILGYSNFLDLIPYISEKEAQESFNLVSFIQELKKNDLIISNSINKNTNFKINYYNNKSGLIFKNFNQSISNKNIFPRPNVIVHNGKEYFLSYDNGLNTENLPYFKKSDIVPNFFAINRDNGKYYKFENGVYSYEAAGEITIISKEEYEKEYFDNDDSMEQFKTLYEETLIPKYEEKSTIKSFMKKLFNWSITNNKIEGSYNPITDRVQISSENIDSLERAEQVFLHEIVGHRGVENLLSNENLDRYNQIILGFSKELDKNANELTFKSGYKSINDFASDYGFKIGSVEYYKELIARVAENKEMYNKNRSWFNQLIFEIKFLLSNIFNIDFNNQDIVQFLIKAKKSVSNNNSIVNNSKSKLKDGIPSYSKKSTDINNNYQSMRNQAVGFIGELNPNKEDRFDSSTYGSFKHFNNNPIEKERYLENVPEDTSNGNKIMLALNGSIADTDILQKTKDKILELHNRGFEFLVGDMPGGENRIGDDKFIDYLKSIGANFTVFGSGNNSRILYQRVGLTEQQRQNIQGLKQLEPTYAVASDEKVQQFIDTIYPEIENQFNKEQITILNSPETINRFNEFIGNTNPLINEKSLEEAELSINVEKLFEDEKFANEVYESLGYKNDTTLPDDNKVHKILSDINKQHHLGNIIDLDGYPIYNSEDIIFQNGLKNITSNQWGHGATRIPYGKKGIERLENILSKSDRFTGDFGPIAGTELAKINQYPNTWESGRFIITRDDKDFYDKDGSLNINNIEIILNRSFEPYGNYLANKYPNIIFKDVFGNIIKISNQLTPKQKQEAIHLYSQYLKQNPNGDVENFKSWIEEFKNEIYESLGYDIRQLEEDNMITNLFLEARQDEDNKRINSGEFDDTKLDLKVELQDIIDNSTNPLLVELARSIQYNKSLNSIKAFSTQKPFITSDGFQPAAAYQAETQRLILFLGNKSRFANKERKYQYLLHELVHHFVDRQLILTYSSHANNIKELFKYAKDELTKLGKEILYGLQNAHEFVTEALTNPDFQRELKNLKVSDKFLTKVTSLFDYLLELISNILGTNQSVLEAVITQASDIFEIQEYKKSLSITPEQKQQALQLYSQYLDTIFPDSKVEEMDDNLYISVLNQLEQENKIEKDCSGGKLKAEKGLQTSFTKNGEWKIIKDLKGYPTHKEGGVDLTISRNGVSIKNGNTEFTAKHGLLIPKN